MPMRQPLGRPLQGLHQVVTLLVAVGVVPLAVLWPPYAVVVEWEPLGALVVAAMLVAVGVVLLAVLWPTYAVVVEREPLGASVVAAVLFADWVVLVMVLAVGVDDRSQTPALADVHRTKSFI